MKFSFFKGETQRNLPEVDLSKLNRCRETYNTSITRFNEELRGKPRDVQADMLMRRPVMTDFAECSRTLSDYFFPK
jgi:hypothetical protein